jgi:hypothetical protein
MPVYAVQFAVTALPITICRIHAEDQDQAIQKAREWALHILEQTEHTVVLGALLAAEEVEPETGSPEHSTAYDEGAAPLRVRGWC